MRFHVPSTALVLAVAAGAPSAHAQTVITREIVAQPVETVTTETVRTVRPAPGRFARRQVVTTRTVTRRVAPVPTVIARTVPAAPQPLYDVATPALPPAPVVGAAPVVDDGTAVATEPYTYRYVYQPDRILVIDPATGIAVQAIPR